MSKLIVQVLKLDPPYPDVNRPNQTLYIDATAAQNLGIKELVFQGEIKNLKFIYQTKVALMDGVLHSLEYPQGNIIRLTVTGLQAFKLKDGSRYWMEWDNKKKKLVVLREVRGK